MIVKQNSLLAKVTLIVANIYYYVPCTTVKTFHMLVQLAFSAAQKAPLLLLSYKA